MHTLLLVVSGVLLATAHYTSGKYEFLYIKPNASKKMFDLLINLQYI